MMRKPNKSLKIFSLTCELSISRAIISILCIYDTIKVKTFLRLHPGTQLGRGEVVEAGGAERTDLQCKKTQLFVLHTT